MNRLITLALVLAFSPCLPAAQPKPVKLFVQWIYGSNDHHAPEKGWVAIGPKLSKELSPVFKWKHYWQVSRADVLVAPGKAGKTRLSENRELEIRLEDDGSLQLLLHRDGKLVRKMKNARDSDRIIMGGDSTKNAAWFAVIRRDKPSTH